MGKERKLNEQQQTAVNQVEGACLLLAVPGSGKTTVLIERLGHLIYDCNINPKNVLTITYTLAATKDMKKRFISRFGNEYAEEITFCTINALCYRILKKYGGERGKYNVLEENSVKKIVKKIYYNVQKVYPDENELKETVRKFTYFKNMMFSETEIKKLDENIKYSKMYELYEKEKKENKAMDFDDQLSFAYDLLTNDDIVLMAVCNRYPHICVDEAQDTSKLQHKIIELIADSAESLFMVGDEDQSIYGFRAAYPKALIDFKKTYNDATILKMEINYRSAPDIVNTAQRFIEQNDDRIDKTMKPFSNIETKVDEVRIKRQNQYPILTEMAKSNPNAAILYRNHESAIPLVNLLDKNNIPYQVKGNDSSFFTHPSVIDICNILIYAQDQHNLELFKDIYYKLGLYIRKDEMIKITGLSKVNKSTPLNELYYLREGWKRNQISEVMDKLDLIKTVKPELAVFYAMEIYELFMDDKNINPQKIFILRMIAKEEKNLPDFFKRLNELDDILKEGSKSKKGVVLSTIHSSKGLEYDEVFIIDTIDKILPSTGDKYNQELWGEDKREYEEERRLFYVAITRAKTTLHILNYEANDCSFVDEIFGRRQRRKGKKQEPVKIEKTTKENPSSKFQKKDRVSHDILGKGIITNIEGDYIYVLFDDESEPRMFLLSLALKNNLFKKITRSITHHLVTP